LGESIGASITAEFQAKLLQYRLENLSRIRTADIEVSELAAPLQDVARTIASAVVGDQELQRGIVQFLRGREPDGYLDSSTELGSAVLEALLFCCHSSRSQVLCGELADVVNTIWEKRGEGRVTTPGSAGSCGHWIFEPSRLMAPARESGLMRVFASGSIAWQMPIGCRLCLSAPATRAPIASWLWGSSKFGRWKVRKVRKV
jgi:hypothetical protein